MDSTQLVQDEAILDELAKQAQSNGVARMVINLQGELALLGSFRNATGGSISRYADKRWSGYYFQTPKEVVPNGQNVPFVLKANIQNGTKSALVYQGRNVGGRNTCGWLVACSNPRDINAKKVYVDCGRIEKFNNINWANIENELNKSTANSSYSDVSTGTAVQARIFPMEDPVVSGSDGIVVAAFN